MESEIPSGFVLVKKGGRPKAIPKHFAVHMARLYYTDKFGKAYLADEELMKLFDISDPSVIRRMVKKARQATKQFIVIRQDDLTGLSFLIEGAGFDRAAHLPVVAEGMPVWVWRDGMTEALLATTKNVTHSISWRQSYPSP